MHPVIQQQGLQMVAFAAGSVCSVLWGGMLILKRQNPGDIYGSQVAPGCGRRCGGTKIPTSHLCLLFSAAFRTHSGLWRAIGQWLETAPRRWLTCQGTAGGGGAGGGASVSAAAASVSTPLVRYDPPQDVCLLYIYIYICVYI